MSKFNPVPIFPEENAAEMARHSSRPLGVILVESGRLAADRLDEICAFQREEGVLFGEAALRLGLIAQHDIDHALARQFDLPALDSVNSDVSRDVFAAYHPTDPEVEALRRLRTALLLRHFDAPNGTRALAVTSADRGDGRSVTAANLAVMFSHLGRRTLLIDADLRHPRQHRLFGLKNRQGLSTILAGRATADVIAPIAGLRDLHLLSAGIVPPNPNELLGRAAFSSLLEDLGQKFDVILLDTPAFGEYGDAQAVAAGAGAALVVARDNVTSVPGLQELVRSLAQSRVSVLGSVLNRF